MLVALLKTKPRSQQRCALMSEHSAQLKDDFISHVEARSQEGGSETLGERRRYNREFTESQRADYREFVEDVAKKISSAFDGNQVKEMHRQRKRLPGSGGQGQWGQPTHDSEGNRFKSLESILQWWHEGMATHWAATEKELGRPEMEEMASAISVIRERQVDLSDGRMDANLRRLKESKAGGDDEVPVEFYEVCMEARRDLYSIVRRIFSGGEDFPEMLVLTLFVMLYKGSKKGTVSEFEAYRPIGLMRHAWKLADSIFVEELVKETELFLDPAQIGRASCRERV